MGEGSRSTHRSRTSSPRASRCSKLIMPVAISRPARGAPPPKPWSTRKQSESSSVGLLSAARRASRAADLGSRWVVEEWSMATVPSGASTAERTVSACESAVGSPRCSLALFSPSTSISNLSRRQSRSAGSKIWSV